MRWKTKFFFQIDTQLFGLPWWLSSKESAAMQQTQVWSLSQEDPWGEGNYDPLLYSCLGYLLDRGAGRLQSTGLQKSQTWLSDFTTAQLSGHFSWTVLLLPSDLFSLLSCKLAFLTRGVPGFSAPSCCFLCSFIPKRNCDGRNGALGMF